MLEVGIGQQIVDAVKESLDLCPRWIVIRAVPLDDDLRDCSGAHLIKRVRDYTPRPGSGSEHLGLPSWCTTPTCASTAAG